MFFPVLEIIAGLWMGPNRQHSTNAFQPYSGKHVFIRKVFELMSGHQRGFWS